MATSDGGAAFPHGEHDYTPGMSLRDYFAARAPETIPEWFGHDEPARDYPPAPRWMEAPKEHHELLRSWLDDGCFDLPEELLWFQDEMEAFRRAEYFWELENKAARYFQWRYHYANNMIAEGGRKQVKG